MKKLLGLLSVTPLAIASCSSATATSTWDMIKDADGNYIIATIKDDKKGVNIELDSNEFFEFVKNKPTYINNAMSDMQFAIYKQLFINDVFKVAGDATTDRLGALKYGEREEDAITSINAEKDTFKERYGNDWESQWDNFVKVEKGYDNETDYMEKEFIFPTITNNVDSWFKSFEDKNKENLEKDEEWEWSPQQKEVFAEYFEDRKPLSIKHVLVKTDLDLTKKDPLDAAKDKLTAEVYERLNDAFTFLRSESGGDGINWKDFASDHSEDGSKNNSGFFKFEDLATLSSVDEFKFATYDLAAVQHGTTVPAGSTLTVPALNSISTEAHISTNFKRTAQYLTVDGETIALVMSQFGYHFIGLDGVSLGNTGYRTYVENRIITEVNDPNSSSFTFHSGATSNLNTYFDAFKNLKMLTFAESKGYISWTDTGFKNIVTNYFTNIYEAENQVLQEQYLTTRKKWDEKVRKDNEATYFGNILSDTALNSLFSDNIWKGIA